MLESYLSHVYYFERLHRGQIAIIIWLRHSLARKQLSVNIICKDKINYKQKNYKRKITMKIECKNRTNSIWVNMAEVIDVFYHNSFQIF